MTVGTGALMKMDCGGGASLPPMLNWGTAGRACRGPHIEITGPSTCLLGFGEVERKTDSAEVSAVLSAFEFSPHRAASGHS